MAVSEDATGDYCYSADFYYTQPFWGELVCGTKEDLQQLGIGEGMAFPRELGGPKRQLNILDPRGFPCRVSRSCSENYYYASISLPGRDRPAPAALDEWAPGVLRDTHRRTWCDVYFGTGPALAAAGLVRLAELPGQPGMRKCCVTIFADGTMDQGRNRERGGREMEPGAKVIERKGKSGYTVSIAVAADEKDRRQAAYDFAEHRYEMQMRALPRPAPLCKSLRRSAPLCDPLRAAEAIKRRAKMKLAWSRPPFTGLL